MSLQFICTKWGVKYPADEVNRLYRALQRVQKTPFTLTCVTDYPEGIMPEVRVLQIPDLPVIGNEEMKHGWRKLTLFSPALRGVVTGPTLYLDLDVVLLRPLDELFTYDPHFAVIKDYKIFRYRNSWTGNTSTFFYNADHDYGVYEQLLALGLSVKERYRNEQEFLCDVMRGQGMLKYWPRGWCASWKYDCVPTFPMGLWQTPQAPAQAKVLVFHGRPKPEEAVLGVGAKWYRPMRAAPWLAHYLQADS